MRVSLIGRLLMMVLVSSTISASGLTAMAQIESALRDRNASRPPDSSSLFVLGSVFFTHCLSFSTYLALLDWRELGLRRFLEPLAVFGLGTVSYAALSAALVALATQKTAVVVVAPFLRVFCVTFTTFSNSPSCHQPGLAKLLEYLCFAIVDALINAASIWLAAFLVSVPDLADAAHVSSVLISLPLVIATLALEQLAYWHIAKTIDRTMFAENSVEEKIRSASSAVVASMATLAVSKDAARNATATGTLKTSAVFHKVLPAMIVTAFYHTCAVATTLRASADQESGFYLVAAGLVLFQPMQNLLVLLWLLYKSRHDAALPPIERTLRIVSDRYQPQIIVNHRLASHCAEASALLGVLFFFVPDTRAQRLADACTDRFASLRAARVGGRWALIVLGELLVDAGLYCFNAWLTRWRGSGRLGRVRDLVSISAPDGVDDGDDEANNARPAAAGEAQFVWFLIACTLGFSSCVSVCAGVAYVKGLFGSQACNMIGAG
ncbi:hypothetical protein DFJ73DRAFT_956789 [Zopfochytrium polystomum]|nr:hypothetical protein DFJ73DRAFT_956789 [Zopfochytrium polystomum]